MPSVIICLPAYNEEQIMESCFRKLWNYLENKKFPWDWKIALIINGSSDNSWEIAQKIKKNKGEKVLLANYPEPGKGRAIKKYWLTRPEDILVFMDIDLAVSLENISQLLQPILDNQADLAVGSRLKKASQTDRSFFRRLTSYGYNFLARVILKTKLPDLQCGFKAMKNEAFKKIAPQIQDPYWFFDTELIFFSKLAGLEIKDVPVNWKEERYQKRKTKMKPFRDSFKFIKSLINLKRRLKNL